MKTALHPLHLNGAPTARRQHVAGKQLKSTKAYENRTKDQGQEDVRSNEAEWMTRKRRRTKPLLVGKATTVGEDLKGVARRHYFFCGRWALSATIDKVKKYIQNFADLLEIVELNEGFPNRATRAFKIVVSASSSAAMLDGTNWPSDVVLRRWNIKRTTAGHTPSSKDGQSDQTKHAHDADSPQQPGPSNTDLVPSQPSTATEQQQAEKPSFIDVTMS